MTIHSHTIEVVKTAHYYTLGNAGAKTRYFHIVLHGYAQKADECLDAFKALNTDRHFLLAPEGFSRFYKKGFQGQVGASWMTKEDRLDEISDYCRFLQRIYEMHRQLFSNDVKIILHGFSQGGSTLMRWVSAKFPYFDALINWAGWIPEDLDYAHCKDYFSRPAQYYVYGLDDPFLTREKIEELIRFSKANDLNFKFYHFNGKHEIQVEILRTILRKRSAQKLK
jgi:predicted esterase